MQLNCKSPRLATGLLSAVLLFSSSCARADRQEQESGNPAPQATQPRDWNRFPAIVERDVRTEVIALGDVHGGYERLVNLLSTAGLTKPDNGSPVGYSWSGGNRLLVCTGDLIDKGDQSIPVMDLMMALEAQAPAAGGEVIITMGNHEAEFLANPEKKKSGEFRAELGEKGIDPAAIARGEKPYGEWMMNRPFAARVNDWFFAHGGNTSGETIEQLAGDFRQAVDRGEWRSPVLVGDDSLLEARKWWEQNGDATALLDRYLAALRVSHIVFGHDPGAFHDRGEIGQEKDGRIFLIDVGMSPAIDYSTGSLLVIDSSGDQVVATSLDSNGNKQELWRGTTAAPGN